MIFQSWQWLKSQWSALSAQLGELPHVYGHTNFPKQFIIETFHPAGWPAPSQTKKGPAEAWEQALFVKTKEKKNQIKSNLSLLCIMLQHCSPHLSMHPHFLCMCTILVTEDNCMYFLPLPCILLNSVASKSSKSVAQCKNPHWSSGKAGESINMYLATPSLKDNRKLYSNN